MLGLNLGLEESRRQAEPQTGYIFHRAIPLQARVLAHDGKRQQRLAQRAMCFRAAGA
jgi:hypothetical protein